MSSNTLANPATLSVRQLHPLFFGRVEGIDLAAAPDDATLGALEAAFNTHAVLLFPAQALTQEQHIAFSKRWGPLEVVTIGASLDGGKRATLPEIGRVTNLGLDNRIRDPGDARRRFSLGNRLMLSTLNAMATTPTTTPMPGPTPPATPTAGSSQGKTT